MMRFITNLLFLIVFTLCSQAQNPGISRDDLYFSGQQIEDPNSGFNEFGEIIKIQGRTMLITASISGVVYVYQKANTNSNWQFTKTLRPSSGCGNNCSAGFGSGAAISPNEGLIVINGNNGVFIYEKRTSGAWNEFETQYVEIIGNCTSNFSLAISESFSFSGINTSGVRIAVSACAGFNQTGVVSVLKKGPISSVNPTQVWSQEKLIAKAGAISNDRFGSALTWSGNLLFISAPGENSNRGGIYTFAIGTEFSTIVGYRVVYEFKQRLFKSNGQVNDFFGSKLIVNSTRLVTRGGNKGYVFNKSSSSTSWPTNQSQTFTPRSNTTDFGNDLTFTSTGFAFGSSSSQIYNYDFSGSTIRLREIIEPYMIEDSVDIFGFALASSGNDLFTYSRYQSNTRSFVIELSKANPVTSDERAKLTNFYSQTIGSNWTNNSGWNNSIPRSWYGVSTEVINGTERITELSLPNNNLKGRIHFQLNQLDYLTALDLSDNSLNSSIPDFSSNTNLTYLNLSNNNYQFGDLEDDFTDYQDALGANYVYSPQKNLPLKPSIFADIGEQVSIPANVSGTQNNYLWYKRNSDNTTTVVSTSETLSFIMDSSGFGTYFLEVSNSLVPNLKLTLSDFSIDQRGLDYRALLAFYNATNGANWTNNTNWLDNTQPISTWHGVTVENGRVISLILNDNNLIGSIPKEIEGLTNLKELSLFNSALLSGTIPSEIGNLLNLETINLSDNNLTGSIPIELGALLNLKRLRLSDTNLTGEIPSSFGNLSNLERLDLIRVPLSGSIPRELMSCTKLSRILITATSIEGAIPNEIGQLQELTSLLIYQNSNMSGEIPEELGLISSLQYISIFENNLEGNIPNSLTNLQNLITLELRNNNLTGSIPDFTNLSQLEYLLLGLNKFEFGDLEPNFDYYQGNLTSYMYSPQQNIIVDKYIQGDIGSNLVLDAGISGLNNTYQWFSSNIGLMPGETNSTLELVNIQVSDYDNYLCIVRNTLVTDMSLAPNTFIVGDFQSVAFTAIPDPNFEQFLIDEGYDDALDGEVLTENIRAIVNLAIPSSAISDLTGIEAFTALQEFSLVLNSVTNLNFSSNINLRKVTIYNNPLVSINLLQNPLLTDLIISNSTGLTFNTIDLTQNSNLSFLDLSTNNIASINLESNPQLRTLRIGSNPLNTLNLTQNTALEILSTFSSGITSLDLSNHPNLNELTAFSGALESLNLKSGNNANLNSIFVASNPNLSCIEVDDPMLAQANTNWIKDPSPTTIYSNDCTTEETIQDEERSALIAFYNATSGSGWADNSNWTSTEPISTWFGVTVNEFNKVQQITLANNNLISNDAIDLSGLNTLKFITLLNNDFTTTNLSSFTFPTGLTDLILPGNNLSGTIPSEFGDLLNLKTLILSANNLEGEIPASITNLSNLEILFLQDNNLSGVLPQSFGNLNNLQSINLSNNTFSGSLPLNIVNPNLTRLLVGFNEFSGQLPDLSSASLEQLWVDNNYYDFSDLAPLVSATSFSNFQYSPQRTRDIAENITTGIGANLTLNVNDTNINRDSNDTAINNNYQWYKDEVAITGANAADYTITNAQISDSGDYFCEITNSILPDLVIVRAPITVLIDANLGITDSESDNELKLYPNPTKNWLTLKTHSLKDAKLTIYDIHGRVVSTQKLNGNLNTLNVEELQDGTYFIKINDQNKAQTQSFIKQ